MIPTLTLGGLGKRPRVAPTIVGSIVTLMDPTAANNATSYTDELGNVYTAAGTAVVKTGRSGFGGSSMLIAATGAGNDFQTPASTPTNILSAGNFTVEAFVEFTTVPTHAIYGSPLLGTPGASTDGWVLRAMDSGIGLEAVFPGVTVAASHPISWATGQVYHVAWSRLGTVHYLGIDGVVVSGSGGNVVTDPIIGGVQIGPGFGDTFAYISHRITRGLALYTASYTPPTAPFTA